MHRSGMATLPLHGGKCPPWLFKRMQKLSKLIFLGIVETYGEKEFIRRMGNAFFLQALGCVIGFDWHSSGLTTTTMGAIKSAVNESDTGIRVVGGKGKLAKSVKQELAQIEQEGCWEVKGIEEISRMTAKIDSACVQDGYSLYHHNVIFRGGEWCVIQQGMNTRGGLYARRYHWLSEGIACEKDWFNDPHSDLMSERTESKVLNLASRKNEEIRELSMEIAQENIVWDGQTTLKSWNAPERHWIDKRVDISERDRRMLQKISEINPSDYKELLLTEGVGAGALRALALTAELIYGAEISWEDPVKFAYAHGGKDGIPFPVQRVDYDNTIEVLENALSGADRTEKIAAINRVRRFFFGEKISVLG